MRGAESCPGRPSPDPPSGYPGHALPGAPGPRYPALPQPSPAQHTGDVQQQQDWGGFQQEFQPGPVQPFPLHQFQGS